MEAHIIERKKKKGDRELNNSSTPITRICLWSLARDENRQRLSHLGEHSNERELIILVFLMKYHHKNKPLFFSYHLHRESTGYRGCEWKMEGIKTSSLVSSWAEYRTTWISSHFVILFFLTHSTGTGSLTFRISVSPSIVLQVYMPLLPVICYSPLFHFFSCPPFPSS